MRRTCRRINTRTGRRETKVTYGLSSLPRNLAGASQLECIWRGHWTIKNRLHYVREKRSAKTAVSSGPAWPRKRWLPSATRSFPCCASMAGPISRPLPAAMPSIRNERCNFLECPHYEITLRAP